MIENYIKNQEVFVPKWSLKYFFLSKIAIIEKYRNVVKYATQKTLNSILECTGVKLICPDYYKSFDRRTYLTRDQKAVFHFKKLLTI